ncbi:hypothetical protein NIES39_A04810 [Arthrospira platensis NIES-39]|nr:hypothetical protein NIES39_A04810 [Arthrospira platensis NIES-39]
MAQPLQSPFPTKTLVRWAKGTPTNKTAKNPTGSSLGLHGQSLSCAGSGQACAESECFVRCDRIGYG